MASLFTRGGEPAELRSILAKSAFMDQADPDPALSRSSADRANFDKDTPSKFGAGARNNQSNPASDQALADRASYTSRPGGDLTGSGLRGQSNMNAVKARNFANQNTDQGWGGSGPGKPQAGQTIDKALGSQPAAAFPNTAQAKAPAPNTSATASAKPALPGSSPWAGYDTKAGRSRGTFQDRLMTADEAMALNGAAESTPAQSKTPSTGSAGRAAANPAPPATQVPPATPQSPNPSPATSAGPAASVPAKNQPEPRRGQEISLNEVDTSRAATSNPFLQNRKHFDGGNSIAPSTPEQSREAFLANGAKQQDARAYAAAQPSAGPDAPATAPRTATSTSSQDGKSQINSTAPDKAVRTESTPFAAPGVSPSTAETGPAPGRTASALAGGAPPPAVMPTVSGVMDTARATDKFLNAGKGVAENLHNASGLVSGGLKLGLGAAGVEGGPTGDSGLDQVQRVADAAGTGKDVLDAGTAAAKGVSAVASGTRAGNIAAKAAPWLEGVSGRVGKALGPVSLGLTAAGAVKGALNSEAVSDEMAGKSTAEKLGVVFNSGKSGEVIGAAGVEGFKTAKGMLGGDIDVKDWSSALTNGSEATQQKATDAANSDAAKFNTALKTLRKDPANWDALQEFQKQMPGVDPAQINKKAMLWTGPAFLTKTAMSGRYVDYIEKYAHQTGTKENNMRSMRTTRLLRKVAAALPVKPPATALEAGLQAMGKKPPAPRKTATQGPPDASPLKQVLSAGRQGM